MVPFMSEPEDWKKIGKRLDTLGRGARARLAEALKMDRSQLARTLKHGGYPKVDQAKKVGSFFEECAFSGPGVAEEPKVFDLLDRPVRVAVFAYPSKNHSDRLALNEREVLETAELPLGMTIAPDCFFVQQLGSTMEPRIWAGARKLVLRRVPPARDQDCLIEFNDGSAVVKTYRGERDGHIFAHHYNPDEEVRFLSSEVRALHALLSL